MEIRNCIYRGSLIRRVNNIALEPKVINFFGAIGVNSNRMEDSNMILYFIAFYERSENFRGRAKRTVNEFCKDYQNANEKQTKEWKEKFVHSVDVAVEIFSNFASKLYNVKEESFKGKYNFLLFQVQMVTFARFNKNDLLNNADSIYEDFLHLCDESINENDNIEWAILFSKVRSTSDLKTVQDAYKIYKNRIEKVINASKKISTSERLFSKELKQQLYNTSKTCKICDQEIKTIDGAQIDHITPYWIGGLTNIENAQLTHIRCNLQKSGKIK